MTTNDVEILEGEVMLAARQASRDSIVFGALILVLGIFAVMAPLFTGISVTFLIGMLLIVAGIIEIVTVFMAESFGKGVLRLLLGGLGIVAGIAIMTTPDESLGVLTIMLAVFFVTGGILNSILAFKLRPEEGWGWVLFSGIISIILGALIVMDWPVSGLWAVGLFVGVRLITQGLMLMGLGRTGQVALTNLQDTRIKMLEDHVRAGAQALQEAQTILVEHTVLLLALGIELQEKVSSSEVDPAIKDLNQKLGEARERMEEAASATKETWDKVQNESNTAFKKLQTNVAQVTKELKKSLDLDK
jgi:uncharacterized membrane protein HdeD (DUF308 family)